MNIFNVVAVMLKEVWAEVDEAPTLRIATMEILTND